MIRLSIILLVTVICCVPAVAIGAVAHDWIGAEMLGSILAISGMALGASFADAYGYR